MFTVTGQLINVFAGQDQVNSETGEVTPGKPRIQILGYMPQPTGEVRYDLLTVSVEDRAKFQQLKGKPIRIPVGAFSPSKGQVVWYVPKGTKPELVESGSHKAA